MNIALKLDFQWVFYFFYKKNVIIDYWLIIFQLILL